MKTFNARGGEDPTGVTQAVLEFISSDVEVRAPRPAPIALTDREQQVLRLLAAGRTGREIAGELTISVPTVQRHIANIYAKIGARGRVEAAAYAFAHGMVDRQRP
jgi:DNA-binding NarL/FixJ family response regulator